MSDVLVLDTSAAPPAGEPSTWSRRLAGVDRALATAGDCLNPILVKETRQAIKSRQFAFTFVLLLTFCWIITIGGVAVLGPGIYYSAAGGTLLSWYFWVLVFPLAVVVPFAAFRSLASEREENTYDLLRVSTLSPQQIVRGKLASTVVQMGVYLSAVAPCIAFTYLLRGVDVVTIAILLAYTTLGSLGLSVIGLMLAALAKNKQGQILLSVAFVSMLLGCFLGGANLASALLNYGGTVVRDPDFWVSTGVLLTIYVTTFALVYLATVAAISYRSENRSTPLRMAMVAQQAAFVGWMAAAFVYTSYEDEVLMVTMFVAAAYWYVMGTLLSTESAELSHRVRRSLPQSTLGRVLLGWFTPGPGTGYFFAVANLTSVAAMLCMAMACVYYLQLPTRGIPYEDYCLAILVTWSYVVIYLGIGKALTALLRRLAPVTGVAGFLIHVLVVLAASGIPYAVQMSLRTWRNAGYTMLQWPNPFWTIIEIADHPRGVPNLGLQVTVLVCLALCVLQLSLRGVVRELLQDRVALPDRVAQDEAELHVEPYRPQNPWEEDPLAPET